MPSLCDIILMEKIMNKIIVDGNTAVARIAYKLSEVIPVYPITPSSPMAEYCSAQNAKGAKNLYGEQVKMIEMQSEAGAAGTLHGALLAGALGTTFTASQGLLLMIPNLYKMSGEDLPAVLHVASRAVASHALNIFCDHSDVMATRMSGVTILSSSSVEECQDMAVAAHMLALKSNNPVIHFFDGFRTSHEIQKIEEIDDATLLKLVPRSLVEQSEFTAHALCSNHPVQFGTAQNPDVFFQNREASEGKVRATLSHFENVCGQLESVLGRAYAPFEYYGNKNAKHVIVVMGSAYTTFKETLINENLQDVGIIYVRLYRPFAYSLFVKILPSTCQKICVLDRTKEDGATGPLALDVIEAVHKAGLNCKVVGGRYGLGGKDFSPACAMAVINNIKSQLPKDNFTVGINDDVFFTSLPLVDAKPNKALEIKIYGLGSDGSVSASKSTIKILGQSYDKYVQGYFEYDSKKSGSMTISHLRISDEPILSSYLLNQSDFISIGNFSFVHKYDCLKGLKQNGIVIINSIFDGNEIDKVLPQNYVNTLKSKNARLFIINGYEIAKKCGLGDKINIIMQMALFKATALLSVEEAEAYMTKEITKTFSRKGQSVVDKNIQAMKMSENSLIEIDVYKLNGTKSVKRDSGSGQFYKDIFKPIQDMCGNDIPVSKFAANGVTPTGTSAMEKRNIASRLPKWIKENCVECGQCVLACPHSALRAVLTNEDVQNADMFKAAIGIKEALYKIQLSPEDCTGCGVCANVCPAINKALQMVDASAILDEERQKYDLCKTLPKVKQSVFTDDFAKGCQFNESYFEFPGACAGCGETPYIKLASMLFGEKMLIANATGCSSIYAGSYPSCPFTKNSEGKGPAWANSLFEDNAEFGLGIRLGSSYHEKENRSVWIIGGDGWAYDIGFGGLDHVLSTGENVNILVLDNESYSNTGGQSSKATPMGASVKLNDAGKRTHKKDLGAIAMSYPNVYVAKVAIGANMTQCIKAFKEAEKHDGPSLILAYSTCINQGFNLEYSLQEMKKAVECGYWPLYRYNPKEKRLYLESTLNADKYMEFLKNERRYAITMEDSSKQELLEQNKAFAIDNYQSLKDKSEK